MIWERLATVGNSEALVQYWKDLEHLEWYKEHPILLALWRNSQNERNSFADLTQATSPRRVIPLRFFGDGAEATSALGKICFQQYGTCSLLGR